MFCAARNGCRQDAHGSRGGSVPATTWLSRLDDAGLRWRLRSALTHLRVGSLAVLGRRLASLARARRTQSRRAARDRPDWPM